MRERIEIEAWHGLALYGLGVVVGFVAGFTFRWAFTEKPC